MATTTRLGVDHLTVVPRDRQQQEGEDRDRHVEAADTDDAPA